MTEKEKRAAEVNFLADEIIKSEKAPMGMRLGLMVADECSKLEKELKELAAFISVRDVMQNSDEDNEQMRDFIEYIGMLRTGLRQYRETVHMDSPLLPGWDKV